MYPSFLWSEFVRLNHIKSLTLLEQKRAYDAYQQTLLQEFMMRQQQLQMQQAATGGGGGGTSTPSVRAFSSAFSNAFN